MKINVSEKTTHVTYEGTPAKRITSEQELRRSVCSCMLWENEFYEDGQSIAARIIETIPKVKPQIVADLAIEARERFKLRHIPLLLVRELARNHALKAKTLARIIQRPDELTEFMALYWQDGKVPLSKQVKIGLAQAFGKFSEYQLAKYDGDGKVKLRDVLFLCHAKPTEAQAPIWKKLIDGTLEAPDTWEVNLSSGKGKKETWERLLAEKKLGGLALLRNLRNMKESKVDESLVKTAIVDMKTDRILPFRFIAAARYAPQWEPELESAMMKCLAEMPKLTGKTTLLVDVSGSMYNAKISAKSDLDRIDAACGLAILIRELCENANILTFSNDLVQVAPRHGFALRDAIHNSQPHSQTHLGAAVNALSNYERLIVLTDEQSQDAVPNPKAKGYMVNVASAQNGIGYGAWNHVDGFSEVVIDWIREYEAG